MNDCIQRTDDQRIADGDAAAKEAAAIAKDCAFRGVANVTEGERWYAALPGAVALSNVVVLDVTERTVELGMQYGIKARYERTNVRFVEPILPEPRKA